MTTFIYIALGIVSAIYAFWLNTKQGKRFNDEYTWASVIIGTSITLIALWFLLTFNTWILVVIAFVVSGIPMIARSFLNRINKKSPPQRPGGRFSNLDV